MGVQRTVQKGDRNLLYYAVRIKGIRPIIMHSAAGIDPKHPAQIEKAELVAKKGSNRTESDDARIREIECSLAIWYDEHGNPTIPATAIRATIEKASRKFKQGPDVREGLIVHNIDTFEFDRERYGESESEWRQTMQFTVPVVVQRSRIMRTRAKIDEPWACEFTLDVDEELVDQPKLDRWLDVAGRRIGLGDWRPEKSGNYGRFETDWIKGQ